MAWEFNVLVVANVTATSDDLIAALRERSERGTCRFTLVMPRSGTGTGPQLDEALEAYLLSVQPGYEDDPAQAVYNRAWILGDDKAISVNEQARIDATTELIPVQANAP